MMPMLAKILVASVLGVLVAPCTVNGQWQPSSMSHIDFEALPTGASLSQGVAIGDQWSSASGVTFTSIPSTLPLPSIAVANGTSVAFVSSAGNNRDMTFGTRGLRPALSADVRGGVGLDLTPPATAVRLVVIDIDGSESYVVRALDGTGVVQSITLTAGTPGTGNGAHTFVTLRAPQITRVEVLPQPTSPIGSSPDYAIDSLSIVRPLAEGASSVVRLAQESAPDAGDFNSQVLDVLRPWVAGSMTTGEFYLNRNSFQGAAFTPVNNRSHFTLATTGDGMSVVMAHDQRSSGSGGQCETRLEITGDSDGARRTIEDELQTLSFDPDVYTGQPGSSVFTERHGWATFDGDGQVISGLSGDWTATIEFTEVDSNSATLPIGGLNTWTAYDSTGREVPLSLARDRRVELKLLGACEGTAWPSRIVACPGGVAVINAIGGVPASSYRWFREGVALADGVTPTGMRITGATTRTLRLENVRLADPGRFRCRLDLACGSVLTNEVELVIRCLNLSDVSGPGQQLDCDGDLTADDFIVFINWFFAGDARADVAGQGQSPTPDGQFTADDIILFINRFFAGC
jgi:hypothetical protein